MSMKSLFAFGGSSGNATPFEEILDIFPFPCSERNFVRMDIENLYSRILTDTLERTSGISDANQKLLWDNCLGSEVPDGLVTLLAKAMTDKAELFIIYDASVKIIRKAKPDEVTQIKADYKARGESKVGVYITFQNYSRTDMVKIYSALEYFTTASLYKQMALSKAIQLKFEELRSSVGASDMEDVLKQAVEIANALRKGQEVILDAKDIIETAKPDLTATNAALELLNQKKSLFVGLPASWVTGETDGGLSDSGKGDSKRVERGLRNYYYSVIKPVIEKLFKSPTQFKSDDSEGLTAALDAMRTFETTSDEFMSKENKLSVINRLFGFASDTKGGEVKEPPPPKETDVTPPPKAP